MPLDQAATIAPDLHDAGHLLGLINDGSGIHHLSKPDDAIPGEHLGNFVGPHHSLARLKVLCSRDTSRGEVEDTQREILTRFPVCSDAVETSGVGYLVWIFGNDGDAPTQHCFCERCGSKQRALDMHVAINEARYCELATSVDGSDCFSGWVCRRWFDRHDRSIVHNDVGRMDLAGEDVCDAHVGYEQIGWHCIECSLNLRHIGLL